jgi:hypothetical protein
MTCVECGTAANDGWLCRVGPLTLGAQDRITARQACLHVGARSLKRPPRVKSATR